MTMIFSSRFLSRKSREKLWLCWKPVPCDNNSMVNCPFRTFILSSNLSTLSLKLFIITKLRKYAMKRMNLSLENRWNRNEALIPLVGRKMNFSPSTNASPTPHSEARTHIEAFELYSPQIAPTVDAKIRTNSKLLFLRRNGHRTYKINNIEHQCGVQPNPLRRSS